jgi:hypothetical protein
MVALLSEFYGHGPTRTKSYYAGDQATTPTASTRRDDQPSP